MCCVMLMCDGKYNVERYVCVSEDRNFVIVFVDHTAWLSEWLVVSLAGL